MCWRPRYTSVLGGSPSFRQAKRLFLRRWYSKRPASTHFFVNYFPCYLFPLLLSGKNTGKKCRDPNMPRFSSVLVSLLTGWCTLIPVGSAQKKNARVHRQRENG